MQLPIQVSLESSEPLYHQIEEQLRALILGGHLPPGTALPSIRALAQDLRCSVITTRRVYQDLENEGMIRTRQGSGTFVAEVGEEERERYRKKAVYHAVKGAIETALRLECTVEELEEVFAQVLQEIGKQRKGKENPGESEVIVRKKGESEGD